jgi:hypothetical protein
MTLKCQDFHDAPACCGRFCCHQVADGEQDLHPSQRSTPAEMTEVYRLGQRNGDAPFAVVCCQKLGAAMEARAEDLRAREAQANRVREREAARRAPK